MAVSTEEITLVSVPFSGSSAMNSSPPIPVFLPVTLPAQAIGLLEKDGLPAGQVEKVSVLGIVTIQAPTVFLVMMEHDIRVEPRQLPAGGIRGHHSMAVGTRVYAEGKGGRRDLQNLFGEPDGFACNRWVSHAFSPVLTRATRGTGQGE